MSQNNAMDNQKKKLRKRAVDKEKIAENKKKIKEKKRKDREKKARLKKQIKERKAQMKLEAKQGHVLEEEVKIEESVVVNDAGAVERTIKVEETLTVEEPSLEKAEAAQKKKVWITASIAAAVVVLAVSTVAFVQIRAYFNRINAENAAIEAMVHMEAVELAEYSQSQHKRDRMREQLRKNAGKDAARALADAARYMIDGIHNRPPEIELTESNTADFATIESCVINSETGKIDVTMSAPGLAISDDGYYYLFEEKTYQSELSGEEYIVEDQKDVDLTFSVNLNYNTVGSRLFSKFVVAVRKGGKFVAISEPKYITNPEAIARYNPSFIATNSKKGLLVDPEKLAGAELEDLGVKHAIYNIPLSRILGNTSNEYYPTVYYTYNGKSYAFNGQIIAEYDYVFSSLSRKGITTTAVILNDMAYNTMTLIHPLARSGGRAPYYAFNAAESEGVEYLAAVGSFLASRYSGSGNGTVMNWVIGNEINARSEWNYIQYMDTESYVDEYAKAFRVFYNAIKSINGNARVYISIDQQWGKSLYSNNGYAAKDIVDEFNRNIKSGGNIDWDMAQHPYNYPLTSAKAWSTSGKAGSYIIDSETTPVISIRNIHVLTNYLQKEEFLTDSGQVRHVILSEMGYTSSQGQDLQAASFVYAYKVIEANRYIDSMLFSRQTDATEEVNQGLALGINTLGGGHKSIYNAYKYVDTDQSSTYTDFALKIIGISGWNEIIRNH
ncbi:MAG: DUF5722 domain-containing protein [Bacillus sp. (in: Bacteria)]|nr:DUF5722 domain-containing protein [Bacillus sp. (in: firmicutes)]MCM1427840.1 DUF5722 domain-containing protein [Eubacterium sp.]